jgi:hypothetical protein
MRISTLNRPWALPAACAPVSAAVVAGAPQLPQVHQVQVQAELALTVVQRNRSYGTNGSTVKGITMGATKRIFDVARGVPPRGRPV